MDSEGLKVGDKVKVCINEDSHDGWEHDGEVGVIDSSASARSIYTWWVRFDDGALVPYMEHELIIEEADSHG